MVRLLSAAAAVLAAVALLVAMVPSTRAATGVRPPLPPAHPAAALATVAANTPVDGHQLALRAASLKQSFVDSYKNVLERFATMPGASTFAYPSNTMPPNASAPLPPGCPPPTAGTDPTCGFEWAVSTSWRSGFFPGLLWQLANETGDEEFATAAAAWTAGREVEASNQATHDVGFMVFGSFGNGIQLGNHNVSGYTSVIVEAAHSLARRYNPLVGMTRSWGDIDDEKHFEVIIDNLMNLELLFFAAAASDNATLRHIAESHATRTGELWIRGDGSTAHLCVFDPLTGKLMSACTGTPQGLAANSTWARGQGWAIYGFTMAYRYTKNETFLKYAETVANFYVANSGADQVPLWDYDAVAPQAYKDTSSAAITASGLLELARATRNASWHKEAERIVYSLGTESGLFAPPGSVSEAVLIANHHDCNFASCTVIESEYYLFEALRRLEGHFPSGVPGGAAE